MSGFSNVLPFESLEGVWDIMIGGAPEVMTFVGLGLLLATKRKIEGMKTEADFNAFLLTVW